MGVFGAVFGCSGDVGFSVPLLGVSSGVGGFNVAMLLRFVREKVRPAWLVGGENGTKFAVHAKNVPKRAISGVQGEFCPAHAVRRGLLGEFYTAVARRGSWWGSVVSPQYRPCPQLPAFRCPSAARPGPTAAHPRRGQALRLEARWFLRWLPRRPQWGFCSIRSWLAACRRRVVPLMTPFPPFGDGPAEPSAASAHSACGSRDNWTLGQRLLYSSVHADHCFAS